MTRINSAIPVRNLTDEHLLAEHREIKRLPYCLKQAIRSGSISKIPDQFVLGTGHVIFFLDKMLFVRNRLSKIHEECLKRGLNVASYDENFADVEHIYLNDYTPSERERTLLIERITERLKNTKKKSWHYYGEPITKENIDTSTTPELKT